MRSIEDFSIANYFLKKYYTNDIVIFDQSDDLEALLKKYPKLVIAVNHGSAAAPAPVLAGIVDNFLKYGGSDRKPLMIVWRAFYKIPLVRHLVKYVSQVSEGLSAKEFLHKFEHEGFTDLFVLPEGENCMLDDNEHIAPFLSPKFVEFAVRVNSPILVVAHEGTEKMSTVFDFEENHMKILKYLPTRHFNILRKTKVLNYPHFFETNIDRIKLFYKIYQPELKLEELADNPQALRDQLNKESDAVHALMSKMKIELLNANNKAKKAKKAALN
jgi:hypothetical protein